MRKDEPGSVQIEPSIIKRHGGTYAVSVGANWVIHRKSFSTLKEARAFKKEIIASRKKRQERRGEIALAADKTEELNEVREQIKSAPKATIQREGREFTLVKLPDDPRLRGFHRDMRDPETLGKRYLMLRAKGVDIDVAVDMPVKAYSNGKYISSDPALHHSQTPQNVGSLDDGGSS